MNIFKKLFRPTPPTEGIKLKATKHCSKCKNTLETSAFNKCKRTADGLQYWCRTCQNNCERPSVEKPKKNAKRVVKLSVTNFQKPFLQLNVPNVSQAQYRQLVEIAKAQKWPMERLYHQMVADFLTLNSK
jgi:hypothetical protein